METLLCQAHNKVDGAINALQKASRLERCDQKLDRLTLLLEAVCEHVGLTVANFGQEAAENEVAGLAAEQEMVAAAAEHEVAVPAAVPDMAAPAAEKEPAAPVALPEQTALQPVSLPTLSLIPPTPHQSQDMEMRPVAEEEDVDMPVAPGLLTAPNTPDLAAQPIPAASKTLDVAASQPTDELAAPVPPHGFRCAPCPETTESEENACPNRHAPATSPCHTFEVPVPESLSITRGQWEQAEGRGSQCQG